MNNPKEQRESSLAFFEALRRRDLSDEVPRKLHAALEQLSARRREVVTRFYFRNQTTRVIAREMNMKPDLARKDLERGRRDLRRAMEPADTDEDKDDEEDRTSFRAGGHAGEVTP
jgi:DNA-directed RNA polymerase specialized sigma24 family protein